MAYAKVIDVEALEADLTRIADGIRAITGKSANITLNEMPAELKRIETEFVGMIDESATEITVPPGTTRTRWYAFAYCTNLKKVTLPEGFNALNKNAFYQCTSLESIVIPSSVTVISKYAFAQCSMLKRITCLAETPPELINTDAFNGLPDDYVIEVLADSVSAYKSATNWSKIASHIREIGTVDYTVTLTGTGGYYDDMGEQSVLDYSVDGGVTWIPVFDADGNEVTEIENATQIQFRINDNLFMIYDFYITIDGVRTSLSIDDSGTTLYTENVTLTDDAEIEYELA